MSRHDGLAQNMAVSTEDYFGTHMKIKSQIVDQF